MESEHYPIAYFNHTTMFAPTNLVRFNQTMGFYNRLGNFRVAFFHRVAHARLHLQNL